MPVAILRVLDGLDGALLGEFRVVCIRKVQVAHALGGVGGVVPADLELVLEFLCEPDARAGVRGDVDARDALLARELGGELEELVFGGSERTDLVGNV